MWKGLETKSSQQRSSQGILFKREQGIVFRNAEQVQFLLISTEAVNSWYFGKLSLQSALEIVIPKLRLPLKLTGYKQENCHQRFYLTKQCKLMLPLVGTSHISRMSRNKMKSKGMWQPWVRWSSATRSRGEKTWLLTSIGWNKYVLFTEMKRRTNKRWMWHHFIPMPFVLGWSNLIHSYYRRQRLKLPYGFSFFGLVYPFLGCRCWLIVTDWAFLPAHDARVCLKPILMS